MSSQTKILKSTLTPVKNNQLMSLFSLTLLKNQKSSNTFLPTSHQSSKTQQSFKCHLICLTFSLAIRHFFLLNPNNTVLGQIRSFTWLITAMKVKEKMKKILIGNYWSLRLRSQFLSKIIWKHTWLIKSIK